jgi:hypothetical protein
MFEATDPMNIVYNEKLKVFWIVDVIFIFKFWMGTKHVSSVPSGITRISYEVLKISYCYYEV